MKHKLLLIYTWFIRVILFFLPDVPILMRFRGCLYSFGMKSCGKNFQVAHSVILNTLEKIFVGDDVYIAPNCVLLGGGEIIIENEVLFGPNVVISANNHTKIDGSFRFGPPKLGRVFIGRGSWVGANCTIVSGARLPQGAILGANSVLNKEFIATNLLYSGVPAQPTKKSV